MTIKQKIIGKSLGTAWLLAAVGLLSAFSMLRIGTSLREDVAIELGETIDSDRLQGAIIDIEQATQKYVAAVQEHRPADAARLKTEINAIFDVSAEITSRLDRTISRQPPNLVGSKPDNDDARERRQLALIEQELQFYRGEWSKLEAQLDGNAGARIDSAVPDRLTPSANALLRNSQELEHCTKISMANSVQVALDRVATSVRLLTGAAVLAILLSLALGIIVAMPLAARLGQLRDGAVKIGRGDLEVRIHRITSNDEIGQLARAFNEMGDRLKHSHDEIQESESKFRELAETIHEVFWVSDPASTKLQYISPAYEEIWGRSRESLYQQPMSFADAISPEDRPRVLAALKRMTTDGMDEEYRIVRPDSTIRWIHDRGYPVRDESGQLTRIVGIAEDITQRRLADQEKHRLAEHVQLLLDSTGEGIYGIDTAGRCTFFNQAAAKLLGYSAEEILGKHVHNLLHHKHQNGSSYAIEECPIYRAFVSGTSCRVEDEVFWRRDGSALPVEYSSFPMIEGNTITGAVVTFSDMTGRKRAQEALRLSEERLRIALDSAKLGTFDFRPLTGELKWDEANKRIWGVAADKEVDYSEAIKRLHPDDAPRVQREVGVSLDPKGSGYYECEYRIVWPDGSVHWTIGRGQVHFEGEGGQRRAVRMVGVQIDITDRKIAEEALQRAHEELEQRVEARTAELQNANEALRRSESDLQRAKDAAEAANQAKSIVFDTALDAIVTIDTRGVITAWNLQAETMFRWDRTEVIGMRLDQTIIPERHWEAHRREIEEFPKKGEGPLLSKLVEIVAIRRDGREFPVEVAITPAWSDGTECTFTAFIRDITLRKQAEADLRQAKEVAESASRAKSEFLANMSHEIRTPLNGVIGMSGLLLETALDERQRRFAELIKSSGSSLADLINDILDFSKIEARKLEIESADFDLYAAVEDVSEMMSMKAAQKGLDLACVTMPDVPRRVMGDSQRVKQILINLINNAIKFTESGSISARLTLEGQSHEHATVRFSITDTGIGIPADRMDRLFKSFSQVDVSTTRTHGGTGLGLAISKQLAELMGGSIGVESKVGCGSTFWFTVRLGLGSPIYAAIPTAGINLSGLRVLAVHHDPLMGEVLRSQLCSWGMDVALTSAGDHAMKMLADATANSRPYDVAILDNELPNLNTMELGKAIKARSEIARTILLVLLPMNGDFEPLKLREAGFSGHLVKPIRQSRLYDTIVDAIAGTQRPERDIAKTPSVKNDPPRHPVAHAQRARILIAEDNRVNQIVASEVLAKYGYACDIVDNGRKAVAAVSTGNYDLVLMDCLMPELDGFEATMQIRRDEQADPQRRRRHMPIIALTANAISGDRQRCLDAGMDDYVSKPLDPTRLIEAIQTLLAKSSQVSLMQPAGSVVVEPSVIESAPATRPPTNTRDDVPPLAIDALFDRCMGSVETVTMILDEFELQAVANLAEIKRSVESRDCEATARVAHALKGASGVLSAEVLSDIAFKLERMGRTGVLADEEHLLTQLDEEVRRCIDYLPTARAETATRARA